MDLDTLRDDYDRVADTYVALGVAELDGKPWLRSALTAFAEQVRDGGEVLDVGCGPGQVSAFLADLGVDVRGIDLSPRMVEQARRRFPALRFDVGSATAVDVPDGSLAGVLGWWSLFHLPRPLLPGVFEGWARAMRPGGLALMGFHVGDGEQQRTEAYGGVPVSWTTYRWQPERLAELLTAAGLTVEVEQRFTEPWGSQVVIAARRRAVGAAAT
ncbi:class I SAM-dependent methyltransferase [Cellulomonas taurus]|uniref:class I SAM-dependent methyltransferase n=1 Tax=Cellulomonas taurus TaxID=2729175 RepID=UPI00145D947E|nr:class I SAM-dependent methyltransferase [Cellulomonas taurus]